ncbi:hypothetical protein ACIRJS_27485 [Streptomyces sp. NPDC102340]|uniref:hypothetical protein n=1 Tax=unclassified Streptomyces TaxID=2593676 RepID=UPI003804E7EE
MGQKAAATASAVHSEPASSGSNSDTASIRLGMPHTIVITVCIVTAAILAPADIGVRDILLLLSGSGGIGAAVVVIVVNGALRTGRIGRLVRAYFSVGH